MTKVNVIVMINDHNGKRENKITLDLKGKELDDLTIERRIKSNIKALQNEYNKSYGGKYKSIWEIVKIERK